MSWHISHRLTTIHRAVTAALLCSLGSAALFTNAYAANLGKTTIMSAQHEPLAASIVVTDIQSASFSASLANPNIYQRMGLTPTDSMTIRFKPTTATSGELVISTTQPVSKPFADVVLALNDGGKRNMVPKTLLMPLDSKLPMKPTNNLVTSAVKPNLPVVSTTNAKPLTVRQGMPPPLLSNKTVQAPTLSPSSIQAPSVQASNAQARPSLSLLPMPLLMSQERALDNSPFTKENSADSSNNSIPNTRASTGPNAVTANESSVATSSPVANSIDDSVRNSVALPPAPVNTIDKQLEILNVQVTRQIKPRDVQNNIAASAQAPISSNAPDSAASGETTDGITAASSVPTAATPQTSVAQTATPSTTSSSAEDTVSYTVQRNDNLWIIAQQVAERNDVDIQTVMTQIKTQNPDAFINNDSDQLRANASLRLPSYDVVPSQQSLQAAINAQRQAARASRPKPSTAAKSPKNTTTAAAQSETAKREQKPAVTTVKTLPKAQFSVLAPGRDGSADGTQTKAAAATGNGLSTDILATLKSTRQSTAMQAKRLSETSSALNSYTRKLQLQNQKLADLQARLKKLRNQ